MVNVRVKRNFDWQTHQGLAAARAAAEKELGANGRTLIRPSGTEPVLRVMVEAASLDQATRLAQSIADSLQ
jgi:phosphoglucosamine mutase